MLNLNGSSYCCEVILVIVSERERELERVSSTGIDLSMCTC